MGLCRVDIFATSNGELIRFRPDAGAYSQERLDAGARAGFRDECRWSFGQLAALTSPSDSRLLGTSHLGPCSGPEKDIVDLTAFVRGDGGSSVVEPGVSDCYSPMLKAGDFDDDGRTDLVHACLGTWGRTGVLWNTPSGLMGAEIPRFCGNVDAVEESTAGAFAGLLDDDAVADLGHLSWGLSLSTSSTRQNSCTAQAGSGQAAVFEMTTDGHRDVAFEGPGGVAVFVRGNGRGGVANAESIRLASDGDVRFDDLTPAPGNELWIADDQSVTVFERQGHVLVGTKFPVGARARKLHLVDADADGRADLLVETTARALLLVRQLP